VYCFFFSKKAYHPPLYPTPCPVSYTSLGYVVLSSSLTLKNVRPTFATWLMYDSVFSGRPSILPGGLFISMNFYPFIVDDLSFP
ncbi:unnamed protein product, partial [Aureobasidium pullulans]